MTSAQETALTYGSLAFAVVWGVLLVPQLISHYARFGRVHGRRVVTTAVVTLYSCLAVAVVLLPLPAPGDARLTQTVQLTPFQWIADVATELDEHGLSYAHAPFTLAFQQLAMNVLLFVPLGMFVVLLRRRDVRCATLTGLAMSLLVEVTQLTANFGTAPYAYRIFDVDDLLANTAGAALGGTAAVLFLALRRLKRTNAAIREAGTVTVPRVAAPTRPIAPGTPAVGGPVDVPLVDLRTRPLPRPR
ncbi:VanZ family protein [Saccharomonospora viridis]|jgi:glycopeptide antibiotics resistance protein|uniref:VanZ family protein n=1 Tax=Saccharomonospora viridis TaxID=1852 RepID=UPI00059D773D|nr:VanZ family protein [Saccharomonospora viridis]